MKVAQALAIALLLARPGGAQTGSGAEPVRYMGGVSIDLNSPEGKLRPAIGVENRQVFRANRTHPELGDGFGWTYNHAPMLAWWNGKFYLEYLSNPTGEHVAPGQTLVITSLDGRAWSKPTVVFPVYKLPQGNPAMMHQRMGFYVAPSGRLLVLAFYGQSPNPFKMGGVGRVVREAYKDGTYGPIYFIRYNRPAGWNESNTTYPRYDASNDKEFVAACEALLADKLMTLQWWQEDQSPDDFYTVKGDLQALSFYHRKDGAAVALWKHSLAALSTDEGKSWTKPVKLPTVVMSGAKVWGQKTADGRYAMVYNPVQDSMRRYPLAIVTGEDGVHYDHLLFIHGDIAPRRFSGNHKDFGVQYVRGIEEGNGTPPGKDLWVTYSSNKEDIWVSRVPLPVRYAVKGPVNDTFDDGVIRDWNIYTGQWAQVRVVNKSLELTDRDPYDYARAQRVFEEGKSAHLSFKVDAKQSDNGRLEIEVLDRFGARPVRLVFAPSGEIVSLDGSKTRTLQSYKADKWYKIDLDVDTADDSYSVAINGKPLGKAAFAESVQSVERLSFRTGEFHTGPARNVDPEKVTTDLPGADEPERLATYYIDEVRAQ